MSGWGATSVSEATVKSRTPEFAPQYARDPSIAYTSEKGDGELPTPATTGFWGVVEFDPSRAKGTAVNETFVYSSGAVWLDDLRGLIDSASNSREEVAELKAMKQDLRREVRCLHQTVASLEKKP